MPSCRERWQRSVDEAEHARSEAAACVDLERQIRERAQNLEQHVGLTGQQLEDVHKLLAQLDALLEAGSQLKEVIGLGEQKRRLEAAGIGRLLQCTDDLSVPPGDWCAVLSGLIARRQAFVARVGKPALRRASGLRLEALRRAFVEQDRQKAIQDREAIRSVVRAMTPPAGTKIGPIKDWTEMWLLKRDHGKDEGAFRIGQVARGDPQALRCKYRACQTMRRLRKARPA